MVRIDLRYLFLLLGTFAPAVFFKFASLIFNSSLDDNLELSLSVAAGVMIFVFYIVSINCNPERAIYWPLKSNSQS